ncbi:unnamed protein product [Amaranthus hypochondriacus]
MINSDKISSQKANRKLRTQLSYKSDHIKRSPSKTSPQITPNDYIPITPRQSIMTDTNKSQNKLTKNSKTSNNLDASVDDFRRTTPGRSPGAGHAGDEKSYSSLKSTKLHKNFPTSQAPTSSFSYSTLGITNDFRPTSPGSSPGAGHSDTNKIGLHGTKFTYCLGVKCLNDFRPTKPGDSPGAGHSVMIKSDGLMPEKGEHSSVARTQAGGLDNYRPTSPGHSPGAGHASFTSQEPKS